MFDVIIRQARVDGGAPGLADVAVSAGRVVAIGRDLGLADRELDAGGRLVTAGFVDSHVHLDKSRTIDRVELGDGSLQHAIRETSRIKADFTEQDIYERAERTLRECIEHGTTRMRTHVEVDTTVGRRGYDAIRALAAEYAWAIDVQICVFAQEGLTHSPDGDALLVATLEDGAHLIGGAPYADVDPSGQLDRVFELARQLDVDIDLHLDLADHANGMQLDDVCRRTIEQGWQGRVTVGHVTQLAYVQPDEYRRLVDRMAEADVGLTVLPATDLFLMGRTTAVAAPRGVAKLGPFADRGGRCSVATNNVLNAFTPYGDGSLIRMANLYANISQVASPFDLDRCFGFVADSAARVIGVPDYGLRIGGPADLVCIDAISRADAVAQVAPTVWGLKGGRQTFNRPPAMFCDPLRGTHSG
jgi:cytosine deaminase